MDLQEYILKVYNNEPSWFVKECDNSYNVKRISNVINNKNYLQGQHKVLSREDIKYKEEEYITRKIVLQEAKTIMNFHSTFLLGKPVSLTGTENMVREIEKIYRKGNYSNTDYKILDKVVKFGDSYEYIYINKEGKIVSKIIDSADGYPVYSETGEYIAFVEYYIINNVSYYSVYTDLTVEEYSNDGGDLNLISTHKNLTGLPIHYHNMSDTDDNYGTSLLDDIKPILNEIEDLLSKMGDSIYTLSLNPLLVTVGQEIEGTVSADATGYNISLENGSDMKYVSANMDYNTIKLYLDTLGQKLNIVAHMPSILGGNSNVANVSEVSLKLLYQLADVMAMMNERYIKEGYNKRFEVFKMILELQGKKFTEDDYVDVSFNYSRPCNAKELLDNLNVQYKMGCISDRTIIEKSPLTTDVQQELERLDKQGEVVEE